MNIFAVANDPVVCAQSLDDKRVVKMTLETTQILSTAMFLNELTGPYKITHKGHPIVKWSADNGSNFKWTISLLEELCKEYSIRYAKTHKCHQYVPLFKKAIISGTIISEFADCSSSAGADIHSRYRACLINKWKDDKRPPKWTNRNPPIWAI